MLRYLVVIEQADHNYAAFSPDLPGVIATGETREKTLRLMQEAIRLHLAGMQEDGLQPPEPTASAEYVAV